MKALLQANLNGRAPVPLAKRGLGSSRSNQQHVVIFGAGNIGRGLLGQLVSQAGLAVVFVEAYAPLARDLEDAGRYRIQLVGRSRESYTVENYRVLTPGQAEAIAGALADCLFAATAVGGQHLPVLAPLLAAGLARRTAPLNILLCENWPHADEFLAQQMVQAGADAGRYACLRCNVERMVRGLPGSLDAMGESGQTLFVDGRPWLGERIRIEGLNFCEDLDAFYARKIFTNNAGHALLAYRGALEGRRLMYEALEMRPIREHLEELLHLAAEGLVRRYNFNALDLDRHVEDLLRHRYANRELCDTVQRVARQPLRKLGPDERLVGLARFLIQVGLPIGPICRVIGAALHYEDPQDPESVDLAERVRCGGPERVLKETCGFEKKETCFAQSLKAYEEFAPLARSRYARPSTSGRGESG